MSTVQSPGAGSAPDSLNQTGYVGVDSATGLATDVQAGESASDAMAGR